MVRERHHKPSSLQGGSGYSDLEVLEKTMRRNPWDRAMMDWFGIDVGREL